MGGVCVQMAAQHPSTRVLSQVWVGRRGLQGRTRAARQTSQSASAIPSLSQRSVVVVIKFECIGITMMLCGMMNVRVSVRERLVGAPNEHDAAQHTADHAHEDRNERGRGPIAFGI